MPACVTPLFRGWCLDPQRPWEIGAGGLGNGTGPGLDSCLQREGGAGPWTPGSEGGGPGGPDPSPNTPLSEMPVDGLRPLPPRVNPEPGGGAGTVAQTRRMEEVRDPQALGGGMEADEPASPQEPPSPPPPPSPLAPAAPETPGLPTLEQPTEAYARQLLLQEWAPPGGSLELPPRLTWKLLFLRRPLYRNLLRSPNPEGARRGPRETGAAGSSPRLRLLPLGSRSQTVCLFFPSVSLSPSSISPSLTLPLYFSTSLSVFFHHCASVSLCLSVPPVSLFPSLSISCICLLSPGLSGSHCASPSPPLPIFRLSWGFSLSLCITTMPSPSEHCPSALRTYSGLSPGPDSLIRVRLLWPGRQGTDACFSSRALGVGRGEHEEGGQLLPCLRLSFLAPFRHQHL